MNFNVKERKECTVRRTVVEQLYGDMGKIMGEMIESDKGTKGKRKTKMCVTNFLNKVERRRK
jgi:3-deoxy-D-arabino-heptulosonate 7-phosphate (DAHP) synthase